MKALCSVCGEEHDTIEYHYGNGMVRISACPLCENPVISTGIMTPISRPSCTSTVESRYAQEKLIKNIFKNGCRGGCMFAYQIEYDHPAYSASFWKCGYLRKNIPKANEANRLPECPFLSINIP